MKVTKTIHQMWKAEQTIIGMLKPRQRLLDMRMIGKWHYNYKNDNGEIGLIKIKSPLFKEGWQWEACGVLEYKRFPTRKAAEVKIYEALKEPIPA